VEDFLGRPSTRNYHDNNNNHNEDKIDTSGQPTLVTTTAATADDTHAAAAAATNALMVVLHSSRTCQEFDVHTAPRRAEFRQCIVEWIQSAMSANDAATASEHIAPIPVDGHQMPLLPSNEAPSSVALAEMTEEAPSSDKSIIPTALLLHYNSDAIPNAQQLLHTLFHALRCMPKDDQLHWLNLLQHNDEWWRSIMTMPHHYTDIVQPPPPPPLPFPLSSSTATPLITIGGEASNTSIHTNQDDNGEHQHDYKNRHHNTTSQSLITNTCAWKTFQRGLQQLPCAVAKNDDDDDDNDVPPMLVTVARSADDGFTPRHLVEDLQRQVLQAIHDRWCGCAQPQLQPPLPLPGSTQQQPQEEEEEDHNDNDQGDNPDDDETNAHSSSHTCRLHVVFDYGPWEGSTLDPL